MKNIFTYAFLLLLLGSCSPKLATNILKTYPPLDAAAYVSVYSNSNQVPLSSEALGAVNIHDSGLSTHCDSVTVFTMAMNEARKIGGNALLITEHHRPSFWGSSCHQIEATILKVSETPQNTLAFSDTMAREMPNAYNTMTGMMAEKHAARERLLPRMTWAVDAGYSWRTAKIREDISSYAISFYKKMDAGFTWDVSGAYFFADQHGLQFSFQNYRASHHELATDTETGISGMLEISDCINYIGAAYVFRGATRNTKWLFDVSIGLGYIGYISNMGFAGEHTKATGANVGLQTSFGVEYMISPVIGIGMNLKATSGTLSQLTYEENGVKRTEKFKDEEREGLGLINALAGIRIHIK